MAAPPPTQLDAAQVLKGSYDEANGRLRTSAEATVVGGDITIESSHTDDSMRLGDGTNYIGSVNVAGENGLSTHVNNGVGAGAVNIQDGGNSITVDGTVSISGTVPVSGPLTDAQLRATPVPISGTITASNTANGNTGSVVPAQATQIGGSDGTNLRAVKVSSTGVVSVDGSATTQPISASSLPLPSGASTSALQTTGNTSLSSIDTKTPTLVSGRVPVDGSGVTQPVSGSVSVSNFPATQPVSGTVTANAGTGNFNVIGTGSAGSAATGVVTIQGIAGGTAIPVSGTVTAANASVSTTGTTPPGSATYAGGSVTTAAPSYTTGQMNALSLTTAGALRTDSSATTQPISAASLPLPSGASTAALQTTGNTNLSSIDGKTPSLGQAVMASSVPVVIASNQSSITISGTVTANAGTNLNTSALALDTTVSGLQVSQGSTTSGQKGGLNLGAVSTAAPTYTTAQSSPLSLTTAGALRVDASGSTQPVSGTVTANQGGTWNINNVSGTVSLPTGASTSALQTTGNTSLSSIDTKIPSNLTVTSTRLLVDPSGVTSPISAASLPLPTGASTAAKQPALGTAGTASTDVITVQGIASMTALKVDGSAITQPISAAALPLPSGASTSALQTTGNSSLASIDTKTPALGQTTMAASQPVTIASNQSAIPVSGTVTANIGTTNGLALDASVTGLQVSQGSITSGQKGALDLGAVTTAAPSYTTGQSSPISLTTAGALRTDSSATTQPISASSLPLPTGAATAALQTQPGVDIGDVTINNGSGASAVNIQDGGNSITVDGTVSSVPVDGTRQSFSAAASGFVIAAAATDVFIIKGSATKTIRITRINVSATTTAGSGALVTCALIKRSTAASGGTSVTDTNVPLDSNNAAATAAITHYTANPTVGTAVGTIRSNRLEAFNSGIAPTYCEWVFGTRPSQAVVLRGILEFLCVNFGGATITGPVVSIDVEWTEE